MISLDGKLWVIRSGSGVSDPRVPPTARSDLFPKTNDNGAAFNFYGPTKNVYRDLQCTRGMRP